jgi:hypothetical protein
MLDTGAAKKLLVLNVSPYFSTQLLLHKFQVCNCVYRNFFLVIAEELFPSHRKIRLLYINNILILLGRIG